MPENIINTGIGFKAILDDCQYLSDIDHDVDYEKWANQQDKEDIEHQDAQC